MSRLRGWVLVCLGTFLILLVGGISIAVPPILADSKNPEATTRFTGSIAEAAIMFGVFSLVVMFGVVAVVSGASLVRQGEINRRLLVTVLWMSGTLLAFSELLLFFF
jgi:hypothetical protein